MTNILQSDLMVNWYFYASGFLVYLGVRLFMYLNTTYTQQVNNNIQESKLGITVSNASRPLLEDVEEDCNMIGQTSNGYWQSGLDCRQIPHVYNKIPKDEAILRSRKFYESMKERRSVRYFTNEPIPSEVINNILKAAGTAPSGAHTEPWTFVVVKSMEMKQKVREVIEFEEEINYRKRMGKQWLDDLKFMRTYWVKEYLTEAPCLIIVFKQLYSFHNNRKQRHYYGDESIYIATGILLTAIHSVGLACIITKPLHCGAALRRVLNRPIEEKLCVVIPIGYSSKDSVVPEITRKPLQDIMVEC